VVIGYFNHDFDFSFHIYLRVELGIAVCSIIEHVVKGTGYRPEPDFDLWWIADRHCAAASCYDHSSAPCLGQRATFKCGFWRRLTV
jgi:hypothetical protein